MPAEAVLPIAAFAAAEPQRPPVPCCQAVPAPRRFWRKRRFQAALAVLLLTAGAVAVFIHRGRQTRLIFMNSGRDPLPSLTVTAAGHTHLVPALAGEASHRWILPPGGVAGPVIILPEAASGATWKWEGRLLDPARTSRPVFYLQADGTVEESEATSLWDLLSNL